MDEIIVDLPPKYRYVFYLLLEGTERTKQFLIFLRAWEIFPYGVL